MSLRAIRHRIYWHLCKYGVVHLHVTRVWQNTRYVKGVKASYVDFLNDGLEEGNTRPVTL
jgi:hypothetical protein